MICHVVDNIEGIKAANISLTRYKLVANANLRMAAARIFVGRKMFRHDCKEDFALLTVKQALAFTRLGTSQSGALSSTLINPKRCLSVQ